MKKTLFTVLTLLVCILTLSSCIARIDKEITGDIITDIEKIDVIEKAPDEDIHTPTNDKQDEEEIEPVKESEIDALGFIQSLGANVRNEENECDEMALSFLQALKDKDTETLSQLVTATEGGVDFVKYMNVSEYVMVPFEFSQEIIDERTKDGSCYYEQDSLHFAVSLKIEAIPDDVYTPFENGESLWYMRVTPYPFTGNYVMAFVKAKEAEENIFCPLYTGEVHCVIDELSVSDVFVKLEDGKNDACDFDFKPNTCIHPVTHMMVYVTGKHPPYSLNEINDFLSKAFDNNEGIDSSCIVSWSTAYEMSENIDYSDSSVFTDYDKKILGCSYAHGGASLQYSILKDEKNGTERTVTVKYYSDFAHFGVSKICVFHFDESGEYPCLLGIELEYDSGIEPALFSI